MVPQEHIVWVAEQPDDVLSTRKPAVFYFFTLSPSPFSSNVIIA